MNEATENKLRSIFLVVFVAFCAMVTVVGAVGLGLGWNRSIWLGVTMAAAQVSIYFARLYLMHVPRTSPGLMGFSFGIFGAVMYSIFTSYTAQVVSAAPVLGMLCLAGWAAYVGWYSDLGDRSTDRIREGKRLPTIELEDHDGNKLTSDDWKGEKRLVLFYRGNWCPICTAQVSELSVFEKEFRDLGVKFTFISPQPHEKSRSFAKKVGMAYDFLVDVDNRAARTLGILHTNGLPAGFQVLGYDTDVPKPTTFVLDEHGKVIFADLTTNHRLRPRPEDILSALRR